MKLALVDVQQGNDTEDYLGKKICFLKEREWLYLQKIG